jgi:hypothetical protein
MQATRDLDFYAWSIDSAARLRGGRVETFPVECPFSQAQLLDPNYWAD